MENFLPHIFANSSLLEIILIISGIIYMRNYFNSKLDKIETSIDKLENEQKDQFKYLNTRIDNLYQLFVNMFNKGKEAA